MVSLFAKRVLSLAPILFLAIVMLAGEARPARAATCFQDLRDCYYAAAGQGNWADMWLAGLDCELDFAACVRAALVK